MKEKAPPAGSQLLPFVVVLAGIIVWAVLSHLGALPRSSFPSPMDVVLALKEQLSGGHLGKDITISLYRVTVGFLLAVFLGVPLGLALGLRILVRIALLPLVNFFRNLSPLAWIPFAIPWFGIGDGAAVFLIFMSVFFPVVLSTAAAVAGIPAVHFRVAHDYGLTGSELLTQVTIPAIMPQIITTLRVTAGLAWLVVVAAEMIAGRDGLGFLIWDARAALRYDTIALGMLVIGMIGVVIDRALMTLTRIPSVRWGYER